MKIHKLPDSPVQIRQLQIDEFHDNGLTWVCLEDIIEALRAPDPWKDPAEADDIAGILEEELLNG
jgi:hypothetical protein